VNVSCSGTAHAEVVTSPPINVYDITVTACNRATCPNTADATYFERQLRVTVAPINAFKTGCPGALAVICHAAVAKAVVAGLGLA